MLHSHEKLGYTDIVFTRKEDNARLSIRLYSHYTCILGDSGIGKTCFFDTIADNAITQEIDVQSEYPLVPATAATLDAVLDVPDRRIILIDESNVFSQQGAMMSKINTSKHLFLCIGRSNNCNGDYPLQGIYEIAFDGGGWFKISSAFDLNAGDRIPANPVIITEASKGRSENELLRKYFPNVISAAGRNNIQAKLLHEDEAVVFADLGNIGRAYRLLKKRVMDNPKIVFYDYQSFEQLLYEAPILKNLRGMSNYFVFDAVNIERFYEMVLEQVTANDLCLRYQHGKSLADGYLAADPDELFQSDIGRGILRAVQSMEKSRRLAVLLHFRRWLMCCTSFLVVLFVASVSWIIESGSVVIKNQNGLKMSL